jgi:RNA polymerase sigma-70 factor, ECF subfamily
MPTLRVCPDAQVQPDPCDATLLSSGNESCPSHQVGTTPPIHRVLSGRGQSVNGSISTSPGPEQDAGPDPALVCDQAPPADFLAPASTADRTSAPPRVFSEATAVARAQDGDTDAFEQLVRSYEAELFRLGFRMMSDRGDAQDAVQDTFVLAWRRLPSLLDPQAFRAWIYQLMTRRCLNLLRIRTRRRTSTTTGPDFELETQRGTPIAAGSATTSPATAAQASAMQDGLTAALATLPPDQRACWVLHEMHDLTYPAIAYAIGVPVSTVRGRIARARLQLAKGMTAWR